MVDRLLARRHCFSVAPLLFNDICKELDHVGLITPIIWVVLEKPIGRDLLSSKKNNDTVAGC